MPLPDFGGDYPEAAARHAFISYPNILAAPETEHTFRPSNSQWFSALCESDTPHRFQVDFGMLRALHGFHPRVVFCANVTSISTPSCDVLKPGNFRS